MRILDLATRIAPFGDLVSELPLLDQSVRGFREQEVSIARIDPVALCFADYAIATAPVLEAFRRASPSNRPVRLALPSHSASRIFAPLSQIKKSEDTLLYDIFLNAPADLNLEELRVLCTPIVVQIPQQTFRRELPRLGPKPHHIDLPSHGVLAAHLEHWVHFLWVAPLLVGRRLGGDRKLIGKNVQIHPRAHLDGAIIGDNTQIGPGCVIQNSYIGPDSQLADFTKVRNSVLGARTHTLADASFAFVVSFGGGTLSNLLLRDVILGRDVFLTTAVIFWDQSLDETIRVKHQGHETDSKRMALGGCAGHGCVLGARTIIAPGRALPNKTTVVMRKEESVHKIESAPPKTAMCWHDGAMVPAAQFIKEGLVDEFDDDRRSYSSRVGSDRIIR